MSATATACADCGTSLPEAARFCPQCGARVAAAATAAGERRPVAILFADLAGFTSLTSQSDAEEVHRLLGRFFELVDGAIARFGGSVDKHIGDATMAVFGAPVAHGDDIERAVRASCAIHDAMSTLSTEAGRPLATHIGIACGEVVAASTGSAVRADYTVIGDAVNLASRLEELAAAGETIVSDDVRAALGARLEAESRGTVAVRGFAHELPVWRVVALRTPDAERHPMVGRASELLHADLALGRIAATRRGETLVLRGDPGVGKSRLAAAVLERAMAMGYARHHAAVLDFGASPGRDAAGQIARSLLDVAATASPELCREALDRALRSRGLGAAHEPFLADLVGLPQRPGSRYDAMDHAARSRGRVDALVALAAAVAREGPIALCIEDVHWAPPALVGALPALRDGARDHPILLVLTTRRDGDPIGTAWPAGAATIVDLAPLTTDESLELAAAFLAARPDIARRCVERAQGNPLFLTQLLHGGADEGALPGSIRHVLIARLDRLPPAERSALQAASVAGQRFAPPLVEHLVGAPVDLAQARARDLVREAEGDELAFSHALIRDAAYASLLHSTRRDLHARAAAWYATRDPVLRAEHLALAEDALAPQAFLAAAQAMSAALRPDLALSLAQRGAALAASPADAYALEALAGGIARDLGDAQASVAAWTRALAHAGLDAERCEAHVGLAFAHRLTSVVDAGMAALDAAEPLAQRLGSTRDLARIAYLRGAFEFVRGNPRASTAANRRALDLAREAGDEACETQALSGYADVLYAEGRMRSAHEAFARCVALSERRGDVRYALMNRCMCALTGAYLLELDASLSEIDRAREASRAIGHRVAEVMADECAGLMLVDARRYDDAREPLARSLALARRIDSRRFAAIDLMLLGRIAWHDGDRDGARALVDEGWAMCLAIDPRFAGGLAYGSMLAMARDAGERRSLVARGEALLSEAPMAHNHLWFRRDAIDASIEAGEWDEARRHADALDERTRAEPLPWSDRLLARVRAGGH